MKSDRIWKLIIALAALTISSCFEKSGVSPTNIVIQSISISPTSITIKIGESTIFVVTAVKSDGSTSVLTSGVEWVSNDKTVCTIENNGLATGVSEGTAGIIAKYGDFVATAVVTVTKDNNTIQPGTVTLDKATVTQGETINVSWSDWPGNVNIDVYKGNTFYMTVGVNESGSGSKSLNTTGWEIRNDYKIKVTLVSDASINQYSETFSVTAPFSPGSVTLDKTTVTQGETITVSWSDWPGDVNIDVYKGNNFYMTAGTNESSSGSKSLNTSGWEIRSDYKIKIALVADESVNKYSGTFSVTTVSGWQTVFYDDFERTGVYPKWEKEVVDGNYQWDTTDKFTYEGQYCAWCIGDADDGYPKADPVNGPYPNNVNSFMKIKEQFDLRNCTAARIRFKAAYWIEYNFDYFEVMVSDGGNSYSTYSSFGRLSGKSSYKDSNGQWQEWKEIVYDLTDHPNLGNLLGHATVEIAVHFYSDYDNSDVSFPLRGVFIDDFIVEIKR